MSGPSSALWRVLERLDYADSPGLVTDERGSGSGPRNYIWRDLHERVRLDAAFFQDGVPLLGFTTSAGAGLAAVRQRLWNYGRVPLLLSVRDDFVTVFNGYSRAPTTDYQGDPPLAAETVASRPLGISTAYARSGVESGRFFAEHASSFRKAVRVEAALLSNLAYLRGSVRSEPPGRRASVDALIGGCLLASYLADRSVLDSGHLQNLVGANSLDEVLSAGASGATALFSALAEQFNGDVFGGLADGAGDLIDDDVTAMASLLRGDDLQSGQRSLWPYDFSVVPADLVSRVYEQLLDETRSEDAAYYTPRLLVDVVLDEVLP